MATSMEANPAGPRRPRKSRSGSAWSGRRRGITNGKMSKSGAHRTRSSSAQIAPSESAEQATFVAYVKLKYPTLAPYLFAIPNGAYKSMSARMKFKREGLSPGYPDLGLDLPVGRFHGLRIEMKRKVGSVVSQEQADWIARLNDADYCARICKGADAAIAVLEQYLHRAQTRMETKCTTDA